MHALQYDDNSEREGKKCSVQTVENPLKTMQCSVVLVGLKLLGLRVIQQMTKVELLTSDDIIIDITCKPAV